MLIESICKIDYWLRFDFARINTSQFNWFYFFRYYRFNIRWMFSTFFDSQVIPQNVNRSCKIDLIMVFSFFFWITIFLIIFSLKLWRINLAYISCLINSLFLAWKAFSPTAYFNSLKAFQFPISFCMIF